MEFAEKLTAYLAIPESDRDIVKGGLLLLQLNRNRVFYQNLVTRPERFAAKLWYELDKYAAVYLKDYTAKTAAKLTKQAEKVDISPAREIGQREDHEQLPEEIKNLWVENLPLLQELRGYHAKLKLATTDCDRHELASIILEIDEKYRKNYEAYDSYDLTQSGKSEDKSKGKAEDKAEDKDVVVDAKTIVAARSYISRNKGKLADLKNTRDEGFPELFDKIQERVNTLVSAKSEFTEELRAELTALGIVF